MRKERRGDNKHQQTYKLSPDKIYPPFSAFYSLTLLLVRRPIIGVGWPLAHFGNRLNKLQTNNSPTCQGPNEVFIFIPKKRLMTFTLWGRWNPSSNNGLSDGPVILCCYYGKVAHLGRARRCAITASGPVGTGDWIGSTVAAIWDWKCVLLLSPCVSNWVLFSLQLVLNRPKCYLPSLAGWGIQTAWNISALKLLNIFLFACTGTRLWAGTGQMLMVHRRSTVCGRW